MYRTTLYKFTSLLVTVSIAFGCSSPGKHRENIDRTAYTIIEQKQMEAFGAVEPFSIEQPEDTLRRRLMIDQNLPYSHPASLGTKNLDPIEHWPDDDYLDSGESIQDATGQNAGTLRLTLLDALAVAAKNNRQYQSQKENVFRAALSLDLARDGFRNTFTGSAESVLSANLGGNQTTSGLENNGLGGISRQLLNGMTLSSRIGLDLVKMLNPFSASSYSLFGDASISIPLLRGAGRHIVAEPLKQAERNALYAIYSFERYKRTFAVNIARSYLQVIQQIDSIKNAEDNYRGLITTTRQVRRQGEAGRKSPVEVDQAIQQEMNSRTSWIRARFNYQRLLDNFKMTLGLPVDADIELDKEELPRLAASVEKIIQDGQAAQTELEAEIPPADAPVVLQESSQTNAGPMELDEDLAIQIALENRLDLRTAMGDVYDAQRSVVVAADGLRAEFTLLGSSSFGEGRSLGSASLPSTIDPNFEKGRYNLLLSLDLPIERTREIVSYRQSILSLEGAVRNFQELEDGIKLDIRDQLRNMASARESLIIEKQATMIADRRVKSMDLYLQWGQREIRDLLDARIALLQSQDSLTAAMVDYRMAELDLQRDLGVLQVDENGMWKEFSPEEYINERKSE